MSKEKAAPKDNLPILLLLLCCSLLVAFWFFRSITIQSPQKMMGQTVSKIELVRESGTSKPTNLTDIDLEFKKLENQEKGL